MGWETVIGLEVHVQLSTRTKMFCGCRTAFGDPPNTNVCPTCLGLPGALPVPNAEAVRLGARAAMALGCTVHGPACSPERTTSIPICRRAIRSRSSISRSRPADAWRSSRRSAGASTSGSRGCTSRKTPGKLLHDRFPGKTAVDLNRAGTPLAEIVSEPDLRSPAEARAYLTVLRQILVYARVSECSMEQGSLRVDANISIRRAGRARLGTKTEVKNLNSFANVERALEAERSVRSR